MAKKVFKADLSISSIRQLQKDLQRYNDILVIKVRELAERLSELGVEIARIKIAKLDAIFTGELIESLHSEYKGSTKHGAIFAVVADSSHAIYVEIGTGIVGAQHPYPGKLPVIYAQGKTIRQLADGRYGWFYQDDNGDWWFTEGMPSRPFLYNTSMELIKEVPKIAKEVFGN